MSHGPEHEIEHAEHAAHARHDLFDMRVTISIAAIAALLACVAMLGHRAHNETLRLQNDAGRASTEAANKWAYYQTKNVMNFEAKRMLDEMKIFAVREGSEAEASAVRARYQAIVDKYDQKLPETEKEARGYTAKADEHAEESHRVHAQANRFDYGELGMQLAVVLCSLAILTKRRGFWYAGLLSALAGCLVALTGFYDPFFGGH